MIVVNQVSLLTITRAKMMFAMTPWRFEAGEQIEEMFEEERQKAPREHPTVVVIIFIYSYFDLVINNQIPVMPVVDM